MSATFAVMDALVAGFRGIAGYTAPGGTGVVVYDGVAETDPADRWVVVGGTSPFADEDAEDVVATTDAGWRTMPVTSGKQTEVVNVSCVVGAWTGDATNGFPDWSALRGVVSSIVDDLTGRLRQPDALGLTDVHSFVLGNGRLSQEFTAQGAFTLFVFDITTVLSI